MVQETDPVSFPARQPLALTPTPLQPLDRVSRTLGGPRIWCKRDDLTGSLLSGNKVRKLEYVVAQALAEGCDTLITCGGVQSNHCRATALVGAQLGLSVCLVLREDAGAACDGNLFLDYLAGADLHRYEVRQYSHELPELLQYHGKRLAAAGHKPFIIPTGASDEIGVWGYVGACRELRADCEQHGIEPAWIVHATGSAGTQAGLTAGAHLYNLSANVLGMAVCDSERYFLDKVAGDLQNWKQRYKVPCDPASLSIHVNADYIGPGYAKADPEIFETIKWLAQTEGIVLDPVYTGKAFHGLITEIENGRLREGDDIIFVHTGGVFGVFPQKDQFGFAA